MRFVIRVAVLTVFSCAIAHLANAQIEPPEGARGAGFTFAKQLISPVLKNPKSADFDWGSVEVTRVMPIKPAAEGDDPTLVVCVQGIVRATNSFNAIVPERWIVLMHHEDEQYQPIIVQHGEQIILKTEMGDRLLKAVQKKEDEKRQAAVEQAQKRAKLDAAEKAGREAAEKQLQKYGRNVKTVSWKIVQKHIEKALQDSGITDDGEAESFTTAFAVAVQAAKDSAK